MEALKEKCEQLETEARELDLGSVNLSIVLRFIDGMQYSNECKSLGTLYINTRDSLQTQVNALQQKPNRSQKEHEELAELKRKHAAAHFQLRVVGETNRVKRLYPEVFC
jgi:hypothetical protein